jgi:DNA-binding CsgD family transcriptional regulator
MLESKANDDREEECATRLLLKVHPERSRCRFSGRGDLSPRRDERCGRSHRSRQLSAVKAMGIEHNKPSPIIDRIVRDVYPGAVDASDVGNQAGSTAHIQRDADLKQRLADSRLRVEALARSVDRLSFGIIVFDRAGRILEANTTARELLASDAAIRRATNGTLALNEPAGSELRRHMADWKLSDTWTDSLIKIPRMDGRAAMSALLMAVTAPAVGPAEDARGWVLFLFDPATARGLSPAIIASELGITYREAQIAALLAAGDGLGVAAQRAGIKLHTARSHVKSVFAKVGVRSQAKLLRRILAGPASCLTNDPRREHR